MRTRMLVSGLFVTVLLVLVAVTVKAEIQFYWFTDDGKLRKASLSALELELLKLEVKWVMQNPDDYLALSLEYDEVGIAGRASQISFEGVKLDTRGKVVAHVEDTRGWFPSGVSREQLLERFKRLAERIRWGCYPVVTNDPDNDVVVVLFGKGGENRRALLAYYQEGKHVVGPFLLKELSDKPQ